MSRTLTRRRALAGGAVAALTSLAGCSGMTPFVGRRREETLTADPADRVEVVTALGDVTVRSESRDDVRVDVVKESSSVGVDLSKAEVRTERSGDRLTVRAEWTGEASLAGRPTVDLDVTLPAESALVHAESGVGDVDVRAVSTVDGDGVDLQARSATGDVTVREVAGTVAADTSTGDVIVRGVDAVGDLSASTGDVAADVPGLDGDVTVEASTGDVEVAVAPGLDAELRASTGTGDVDVEGVELDSVTETDEEEVRGRLGEGGPRLTLEASTGDVTVTLLS